MVFSLPAYSEKLIYAQRMDVGYEIEWIESRGPFVKSLSSFKEIRR